MKLIDVLTKLKALNVNYMHTRDVATYFNVSTSHASKMLSRLCQSNQLVALKPGVWVFPDVDRFALPAILTAPFPCYISLQSALYFHGMISQIPEIIYAVSLARTKVYRTSLGTTSVHHINSNYYCGYEATSNDLIKMASPEKALIDILYLSDAKTRWFNALPELELPSRFKMKKARDFINLISSKRKKSVVESKFNKLNVINQ